jgi:hypothetical protein
MVDMSHNEQTITDATRCVTQLSLSRLNHGQPGVQAHPAIVQGTAEFHHEIADARLPQADPVFHHATTLDAAVDMLDPQPPLVERLVGPLLLQGGARSFGAIMKGLSLLFAYYGNPFL